MKQWTLWGYEYVEENKGIIFSLYKLTHMTVYIDWLKIKLLEKCTCYRFQISLPTSSLTWWWMRSFFLNMSLCSVVAHHADKGKKGNLCRACLLGQYAYCVLWSDEHLFIINRMYLNYCYMLISLSYFRFWNTGKNCLCIMQHYLNYSCVASGVLHFKMLPWPNVYIYAVFLCNPKVL